MISKALRPADPQSNLLKRVSHHFLSDAANISDGEPDPLVETPTAKPSAKAAKPAGKDKQAKPGKSARGAKADKSGKKKKSRKPGKEAKTGKGKTSHETDTKTNATALKPARSGKTATKKAVETPVAAASTAAAATHSDAEEALSARRAPPAEVGGTDAVPAPNTPPATRVTLPQAEQETERESEIVLDAPVPNLATAASRRHMRLHSIMVCSLIALFALWGYRYWHTAHDTTHPGSTGAGTTKAYQEENQPAVAVSKDTKASELPPAAAPVMQAATPEAAAETARAPEPETAAQVAAEPPAAQAPPRYRPPAYGRYPRGTAWGAPPFYGTYPLPPFPQPPFGQPPPRFPRGQAADPEATR